MEQIILQQAGEKFLRGILRRRGVAAGAPRKHIERIPVGAAEFLQGSGGPGIAAEIRGAKDKAPVRGGESTVVID